jgi:hypothetical protein
MRHVFLFFLVACTKTIVPDPLTPVEGSATCETVCARAAELGCSWALPTSEGATCEEVCAHSQASGILTLNLECRSAAASCEASERCED